MARNNNNFIHKKTLITENSVSPDAVFNTDDLIAGQGGLTTGGILSIAIGNNQTFMNYDSDDGGRSLSPLKGLEASPANFGTKGPSPHGPQNLPVQLKVFRIQVSYKVLLQVTHMYSETIVLVQEDSILQYRDQLDRELLHIKEQFPL